MEVQAISFCSPIHIHSLYYKIKDLCMNFSRVIKEYIPIRTQASQAFYQAHLKYSQWYNIRSNPASLSFLLDLYTYIMELEMLKIHINLVAIIGYSHGV